MTRKPKTPKTRLGEPGAIGMVVVDPRPVNVVGSPRPVRRPPRPKYIVDALIPDDHDRWTVFIPAPTHDPKDDKPFPPSKAKHVFLSANARVHDQVRAAVVRAWRADTVGIDALANVPHMQRIRVITAYHKRTANRYDPANLYPVGKAIVDALVDVGIVVDDDHEHVVGPDPRHGKPRPSDPGVTVTIERLA